MKINLQEEIKTRIFDELEETLGRNSNYKDKVKVYHKFAYKERVSHGVVLKNISSSRLKLSPDDYIGTLKSHFSVARAGDLPGEFLAWAWEDTVNMVKYTKEDVSAQITGTNREIALIHKPITKGPGNTDPADNFRQVDVLLNGERVYAEDIYPEEGKIRLFGAPAVGAVVEVGYYYKNITPPGRYYLEIVQEGTELKYVVNPLYGVKGEVAIENARGTELGCNLENTNIMVEQVSLYMRKPGTDYEVKLIKGQEFLIDSTGLVTFIGGFSMEPKTNLVANYRWVGEEIGPKSIPKGKRYDNETLSGVSLCFTDRVNLGDKAVLQVYPKREIAASVYGGHFKVNLDLDIFTMDTVQLPGLVDYVVNDLWNLKRIPLMDEGITIEEIDPTGESEEVYDENTGDLYFKSSINIALMTEWKRFVPTLFDIADYDISFQTLTLRSNSFVQVFQGRDVNMEAKLYPKKEPFEVSIVKPGFPRIS